MSRAVMRRHAPDAEPIGVAALANHRFLISRAASDPHGLRRVMADHTARPRHTCRLSAILPVRQAGQRRPALVYLARSQVEAPPQAGYTEVVVAAALEWQYAALH
jgi:hypothetical protein